MRLTFKANNPFTGKEQYYPDSVYDDENTGEKMVDFNKQTECNNKLGQLEDLEDELGVDLITLFRILRTDGHIWVKNRKGIHEWHVESLKQRGLDGQWYLTYSNNVRVRLKDYGKTWALTKEELERDLDEREGR